MFLDWNVNALPSMIMLIAVSWLGFMKGVVQFIFAYCLPSESLTTYEVSVMPTEPPFLTLKVRFVGELTCEVSMFNDSRPGQGVTKHPGAL